MKDISTKSPPSERASFSAESKENDVSFSTEVKEKDVLPKRVTIAGRERENSLTRTLECLAAQVADSFGAPLCVLFLSTGRGWWSIPGLVASSSTGGPKLRMPPDVDEGLVGWITARKDFRWLSDLRQQPSITQDGPLVSYLIGRNLLSLMSAPLVVSNELVGAISVHFPALRQPDPQDLRLMNVLAGTASTVLELARRHESDYTETARCLHDVTKLCREAERKALVLQSLQEIHQAIVSQLGIEEVLSRVVREVSKLVDADGSAVQLLDEAKETRTYVACYGSLMEGIEGTSRPAREGLAGWVIANARPTLSNDIRSDERTSKDLAQLIDANSVMLTPLVFGGEVFGCLSAFSKRGQREFVAEDLALLDFFGQQAAIAIENATLYERLLLNANRDSMTQVYNHSCLMERLTQEVERSARHNEVVSFMMLDMDNFKEVNDTFGHTTGDLVLVEVAAIIKNAVRKIDTVGRYGGDEFGVILPETDAEHADVVGARIRDAITGHTFPPVEGPRPIRLGATIGISTFPTSASSAVELVSQADNAMLALKREASSR